MTPLKLSADYFYVLKPRQMIYPNRYIVNVGQKHQAQKSPIRAILSLSRVDF